MECWVVVVGGGGGGLEAGRPVRRPLQCSRRELMMAWSRL